MAETKVSKKNKSENNIQETDTKVKSKSKKSKVKDEPLESKVEPLDNVQVDVEIDCRSNNHSDVVNGYIRHKRSI